MVDTKASVHTHGDVYSIAFRSGRRRFSLETSLSQLHRNVLDAMKLDMCTRKPESTGIVGIAQLAPVATHPGGLAPYLSLASASDLVYAAQQICRILVDAKRSGLSQLVRSIAAA
jgi:hypothetical protein